MSGAELLYPSAPAASASPAASGPVPRPAEPATPPAPVGDPGGGSADPRAAHVTEQPEAVEVPAASLLYDDLPPTHGRVAWSEPAAAAATIFPALVTPDGYEADDAAMAERGRFADARAAVGAGRTFANEIWTDLVVANKVPIRTSADDAMLQLRRVYGPRTDAKMAAANAMIQRFDQLYPGTWDRLRSTGLANSPDFIRKVVRFAERRR